MMNFKEKDKVILKSGAHVMINDEDKTGVIGIVHKVIDTLNIVLVEFDGNLIKVPADILEPYKEKNENRGEETITISRKDFKDALMKAVDPKRLAKGGNENMSPIELLTVGMTGIIICKDVEKILFGDVE